MNIYSKYQFNKEFRQEGALSKAFISTNTYSKSDFDKKMDEITKFFGIHSADVTKMEGKKEGEYYIRVTIPRSAFKKIDLPEPVFVDRIIGSIDSLPNELQVEAYLDLSEEDFQEMTAKLKVAEKITALNEAMIIRFREKIADLQNARESLIQSFTKFEEEIDIEDPDIQHLIENDFNDEELVPEILFKIENARNALDENITVLRTPLLSLDEQMQKALGTDNDLATKNKLVEIPTKELFNLLNSYLEEQHKAIIEAPFKKLVQQLERVVEGEEGPPPYAGMLFNSFIYLFGKKMLKTNTDVLINFLNTPLIDDEDEDLFLKKNTVADIKSYIQGKISSEIPRESRLDAWKKIIDLYRKKDFLKDAELSRYINYSGVDSQLKAVNEIPDMEKEIELVRLMKTDPVDPDDLKDKLFKELAMRLVTLKPPSMKAAEELVLEVTPEAQTYLEAILYSLFKEPMKQIY